LQCRAASKKKRQCQGSRGGGPRSPPPRLRLLALLPALLLRSLSVVPWLCAKPLPELVRVSVEGPCMNPFAEPAAVADEEPPRPPSRREEEEASEEVDEVEPRLLLLPGGRPGPRTCGTHLIPRAVQIWQGFRRLQRFCRLWGGVVG
jgi:hypothetical protein